MSQFTVVSWNCRRATADSPLWDYLLELDPTVALLQEVGGLSAKTLDRFAVELRLAAGRTGSGQEWSRLEARHVLRLHTSWTLADRAPEDGGMGPRRRALCSPEPRANQ